MKKRMNQDILKKLINHFLGLFRFIEENSQINMIKSISRNKNKRLLFEIGPIGSTTTIQLTLSELFREKRIFNMIRHHDQQILKIIAFCQGDLIITSKEFLQNNREVFMLQSLLTGEKLQISTQTPYDKEILYRINTDFVEKKI